MKTDFIRPFSAGLLQINKLANVTLIDKEDPILEKGMYLRASQQVEIISDENKKLNNTKDNSLNFGEGLLGGPPNSCRDIGRKDSQHLPFSNWFIMPIKSGHKRKNASIRTYSLNIFYFDKKKLCQSTFDFLIDKKL